MLEDGTEAGAVSGSQQQQNHQNQKPTPAEPLCDQCVDIESLYNRIDRERLQVYVCKHL